MTKVAITRKEKHRSTNCFEEGTPHACSQIHNPMHSWSSKKKKQTQIQKKKNLSSKLHTKSNKAFII